MLHTQIASTMAVQTVEERLAAVEASLSSHEKDLNTVRAWTSGLDADPRGTHSARTLLMTLALRRAGPQPYAIR